MFLKIKRIRTLIARKSLTSAWAFDGLIHFGAFTDDVLTFDGTAFKELSLVLMVVVVVVVVGWW